jgi:hypothetical protein
MGLFGKPEHERVMKGSVPETRIDDPLIPGRFLTL